MTYGENKISLEKIKNVIENDYYHSLISPNVELKVQYATEYNGQNYVISFQRESIASILLIGTILIIYFKKKKNNDEVEI